MSEMLSKSDIAARNRFSKVWIERLGKPVSIKHVAFGRRSHMFSRKRVLSLIDSDPVGYAAMKKRSESARKAALTRPSKREERKPLAYQSAVDFWEKVKAEKTHG